MVELRRVGEEDWPSWRLVRHRALTESPEAFGSTLASWQGSGDTEQRWRDRLSSVPFNVVADHDGSSVGQVSATAPDDGGIIELISLWVAPEGRGRGIGDSLVAAVLDWARDHERPSVRLWVKAANAAAQRLYERHGFVPTGIVADDEVEMLRSVGAPAVGRHPSRT